VTKSTCHSSFIESQPPKNRPPPPPRALLTKIARFRALSRSPPWAFPVGWDVAILWLVLLQKDGPDSLTLLPGGTRVVLHHDPRPHKSFAPRPDALPPTWPIRDVVFLSTTSFRARPARPPRFNSLRRASADILGIGVHEGDSAFWRQRWADRRPPTRH
jgi:hypothetical protein